MARPPTRHHQDPKAISAPTAARQELAPDLVDWPLKWVEWQVKQMAVPPSWWGELVLVLWKDGEHLELLAKYLALLCKLPRVQFASQGAYWMAPPCLGVFKWYQHMPLMNSSFTSTDFQVKEQNKMINYTQSLLEFAKCTWANSWPKCLRQSLWHLQTLMEGFVDFIMEDLMGLKTTAMPKMNQKPPSSHHHIYGVPLLRPGTISQSAEQDLSPVCPDIDILLLGS